VTDVERRDDGEEQAVFPALQALSLVDYKGIPPVDLAEDARVLLKRFVGDEDDVGLQRSGRVEELVVFDDLAGFTVAL
jgi:hypothetical protein